MDPIIVPKISVIIPVYNSEKYIFQAVESIVNQTFTDFELIIINDGSTDRSEEIILSFTDSRIRFFRNEINLGIVPTRNSGLKMAKGEFIAMMDADDISFPGRLEKQLNYMLDNISVGVCGSRMECIGDQQGTFGTSGSWVSAFTNLMHHPPFGQSSAFIRKSILSNLFLKYKPEYPHAEDYKLWLDISKHAKIYCLSDTLVYYRWHTKNDSLINSQIQIKSSKKVQKEWFEHVYNRKLAKKQADFFSKENRSIRDYLHYNFLCLLILKTAQIELDFNLIMEHRMRINRRALKLNTTTVSGKILTMLVSKMDQSISKMVVFLLIK